MSMWSLLDELSTLASYEQKHAPGDLVDEGKLLLFLQTEVTNRVPRCGARLLAHQRRQKRQADAKPCKRPSTNSTIFFATITADIHGTWLTNGLRENYWCVVRQWRRRWSSQSWESDSTRLLEACKGKGNDEVFTWGYSDEQHHSAIPHRFPFLSACSFSLLFSLLFPFPFPFPFPCFVLLPHSCIEYICFGPGSSQSGLHSKRTKWAGIASSS